MAGISSVTKAQLIITTPCNEMRQSFLRSRKIQKNSSMYGCQGTRGSFGELTCPDLASGRKYREELGSAQTAGLGGPVETKEPNSRPPSRKRPREMRRLAQGQGLLGQSRCE